MSDVPEMDAHQQMLAVVRASRRAFLPPDPDVAPDANSANAPDAPASPAPQDEPPMT